MGKDAGHDVGQCPNRASSDAALVDGAGTRLLEGVRVPGRDGVRDLLRQAMSACVLELEQIAELLLCTDPADTSCVHQAARRLKTDIFGKRVFITAGLSLQGSPAENRSVESSWSREARNRNNASSQEAINDEVRKILGEGLKRGPLVTGNSAEWQPVGDAISATRSAPHARARIQRSNLRTLFTRPEDVQRFRECRGGTFQLYPGTYHLPIFLANNPGCSDFDYEDRLTAPERAMESDATDLGLGVSFGSYDARYEALALACSIQRLRRADRLGSRTIQVSCDSPQVEHSSTVNRPRTMPRSDQRRVIPVLRLANPYSGLIVTRQESSLSLAEMLTLGATQVSLATNEKKQRPNVETDGIHPVPPLKNRDGLEAQAMRGSGRRSCLPNALLTLQGNREVYGCSKTDEHGQRAIQRHLLNVRSPWVRKKIKERLERVSNGEPELSY